MNSVLAKNRLETPSNGRNTKQSRKRGTDTRGMVVGRHKYRKCVIKK
jgi:hypothetical protein